MDEDPTKDIRNQALSVHVNLGKEAEISTSIEVEDEVEVEVNIEMEGKTLDLVQHVMVDSFNAKSKREKESQGEASQ